MYGCNICGIFSTRVKTLKLTFSAETAVLLWHTRRKFELLAFRSTKLPLLTNFIYIDLFWYPIFFL